ncbi:MAG: glycosyltransferase family 4 protein [Rhodoferax sp.]|nr:glycosyltransferase family 4 protein [Rhodoferax sp.]
MRIAIVTNIPAPYRVPVYNLLAARKDVQLHVFYASEREPDRSWDLPPLTHPHTFLPGRMVTRGARFIHHNPQVYARLGQFQPDVVVTTGFNPVHLFAFAWARLHRRRHIAMTDGTLASEAGLSTLHRMVRRFVFTGSRSFVAASNGGRALLASYGIAADRVHASPLCANANADWSAANRAPADVDLLFSGRLVTIKNPLFALQVANDAALALGRRVSIAFLGSGPLDQAVGEAARSMGNRVDVHFAGHVRQADLPNWFYRARLFIFPTTWDPWGVVANEACMAGLPVLVSPHAGVAGELIRDGVNGRVLPLDIATWTAAAVELLSSPELRERMGTQARGLVAPYNFERAAQGIVDAAQQATRQRVVCVQRRLTHYRVPLFERMRVLLAQQGVTFELVYGDPTPDERSKRDGGSLAWGKHVPCHYFWQNRLCWQNFGSTTRGADLVIVTQENKLLYNLLAVSLRRPKRLAFWGHGRNFQSLNAEGLSERFKRWTSRHVDWWFAYTGLSELLVQNMGFRDSRITNLENAVDTHVLADQCEHVTLADVAAHRSRLNLGDGLSGIFVGSLYAEKRLEFLLEAGKRLAAEVPGFHLVVVGDGPQRWVVEAAAQQEPWLRYTGPVHGFEKAVSLRAASLMLNPGLVGLGILDAFVAGLPLVTTDCKLHSPEIDYLRNGENGLMTADSIDAYVAACRHLLLDSDARRKMGAAGSQDAARYTMENMTQRFCAGVLAALKVQSP